VKVNENPDEEDEVMAKQKSKTGKVITGQSLKSTTRDIHPPDKSRRNFSYHILCILFQAIHLSFPVVGNFAVKS